MINTIYADLPGRIRAMTQKNEDGSYTVVLNSRLTHERLVLAYQHELHHILNGDFDRDDPVGQIEREAHEKSPD